MVSEANRGICVMYVCRVALKSTRLLNPQVPNERNTEQLVRKLLEKHGYTAEHGFIVEEQKSANPTLARLMQRASKSGSGVGKPEFIITKDDDRDFLIVIECKAGERHHESAMRDQFKDYAVDGALLYASHFAKERTVIAIGVSGETVRDLRISTFVHLKGSDAANELRDVKGKILTDIVPWGEYLRYINFDPAVAQMRFADLLAYSRELHNYMRDYAKITEAQKPLLVSGVLLALMERGFAQAFTAYEGEELAEKTYQALSSTINKAQLGDGKESKKKAVMNAFSFIEHHPELHKINTKEHESPLMHIIGELKEKVQPFIRDRYDFDIIGAFYREFIRYTGGDGKGLGIVLTPRHITELFADLAKLHKKSIVLDICAGTSGFLISAMQRMTSDKKVSDTERNTIITQSLIGIEQEPTMYALAVSNMILHGDGKTNIHQGSCFDDALFDRVKGKATAGFINPPYSQKGESLHEWDFIRRMLDGLARGATGIAIVPMGLAIAPHALRERILVEHRLEAVMSMPDDLFYPVGVVTCIMVFTAHTPHDSDDDHETWFGYWKDDGFVKDKKEGRIDKRGTWTAIKNRWIKAFTNKKEIPGESVSRRVTADDEWCAEAYLETDYSKLNEKDFEAELKKYFAFQLFQSKES